MLNFHNLSVISEKHIAMLSPTFRYIHPSLEIPAEVQAQILPDASLSVLDFLQFPLPIISGAATCHKPSDFFSSHTPTIHDIQVIKLIPIPPAKTVTDIVAVCKGAIMSGTRSVKCPHAPSASKEKLPVWVILYWAEVLQLRTTSYKARALAKSWVSVDSEFG